jgi:hypothetical protein
MNKKLPFVLFGMAPLHLTPLNTEKLPFCFALPKKTTRWPLCLNYFLPNPLFNCQLSPLCSDSQFIFAKALFLSPCETEMAPFAALDP